MKKNQVGKRDREGKEGREKGKGREKGMGREKGKGRGGEGREKGRGKRKKEGKRVDLIFLIHPYQLKTCLLSTALFYFLKQIKQKINLFYRKKLTGIWAFSSLFENSQAKQNSFGI